MTFSRKEWKDAQEKLYNGQRADLAANQATALRTMEQAAVAARHVTGDVHWDRYQSMVTASVEHITSQIGDARQQLADSALVEFTHIMQIKLRLARLEGMKAMADGLLQLPSDIIKLGEAAKLQLAEIDQTDE